MSTTPSAGGRITLTNFSGLEGVESVELSAEGDTKVVQATMQDGRTARMSAEDAAHISAKMLAYDQVKDAMVSMEASAFIYHESFSNVSAFPSDGCSTVVMRCEGCGDKSEIGLPTPYRVFHAAFVEFGEAHRHCDVPGECDCEGCKPTQEEP